MPLLTPGFAWVCIDKAGSHRALGQLIWGFSDTNLSKRLPLCGYHSTKGLSENVAVFCAELELVHGCVLKNAGVGLFLDVKAEYQNE